MENSVVPNLSVMTLSIFNETLSGWWLHLVLCSHYAGHFYVAEGNAAYNSFGDYHHQQIQEHQDQAVNFISGLLKYVSYMI